MYLDVYLQHLTTTDDETLVVKLEKYNENITDGTKRPKAVEQFKNYFAAYCSANLQIVSEGETIGYIAPPSLEGKVKAPSGDKAQTETMPEAAMAIITDLKIPLIEVSDSVYHILRFKEPNELVFYIYSFLCFRSFLSRN